MIIQTIAAKTYRIGIYSFIHVYLFYMRRAFSPVNHRFSTRFQYLQQEPLIIIQFCSIFFKNILIFLL